MKEDSLKGTQRSNSVIKARKKRRLTTLMERLHERLKVLCELEKLEIGFYCRMVTSE